MPLALYISVDGAGDAEKTLLKRFLERSSGVVFLDLLDSKTESLRNRISVEINKPTPEEQQQLWTEALQELAPDQTRDQPQRLAEQFSFNQNEIKRLAKAVLDASSQTPATLSDDLWQACRIAARAGMEQLATRITAKAQWNSWCCRWNKKPCCGKLPIRLPSVIVYTIPGAFVKK